MASFLQQTFNHNQISFSWKTCMPFFLFLLCLAFFSLPTFSEAPNGPLAGSLAKGWQAFISGDYEAARTAAQQGNTANDAALSCRTGLIIGGFFETGAQAVTSLHRAISDCEAALRHAPDHTEARLSLALATAFEGKRLKKPNLVKNARKLICSILKADSENPSANGALGGWHASVAGAGMLARIALGARNKTAEDQFAKAFAQDPNNLPMLFEYAKFMAVRGQEQRAAALDALTQIASLTPSYAFEAFLQEKAVQLQTSLENGDRKSIQTAVKDGTAFPGIEEQKKRAPFSFDDTLFDRLTAP